LEIKTWIGKNNDAINNTLTCVLKIYHMFLTFTHVTE
jgi:hypothetical protein